MKTKLNSSFVIPQLSFALLAALALCLTAIPARAQSNYWGYALSFNGASYVSVAYYSYQLDMTNNYTLECWFKTAVYSQWGGLVDKYQSNGIEGYFIRYRDGNLDFDQLTTSGLNLQPGIWHFVAGVNSNGTRHLYLDGVEQTIAGTAITPFIHSGPLCVGVDYTSRYFHGQIDEVRIWNVARGKAQVQADMFQQLTGNEPGLVTCYHFDEGSGDIAHDAVTNHNGGILVNGPAWVVSTAPFPFTYTTNNGTITITGYTGAGGDVAIPGTINGPPVTSIGGDAFANSSVTNVTIPDSVISIGTNAFYDCYGLTSVTIGTNVSSIGNYAFYDCCGLRSVTIPDSVNSIGVEAFIYCFSMTNVTIGSSVTSIGEQAFWSCNSLTGVTIGTNVSSIGDWAFAYCGLTRVSIPDSVTSIGDGAFGACISLTNIAASASNPAYSSMNGVLFDKAQAALLQFPGGLGGSYTIPNSVASIGDWAFADCGLTCVSIPDSVTSIGANAFYVCSGLTSVTIGTNVSSIGNHAFYDCCGLRSVTIPDSVTSIGDSAFYDCSGLTSVTIGTNVSSIGDGAFAFCGLTGVYFRGNAPGDGSDTSVFYGDGSATLYYVPGTTGWVTPFDGCAAVLWNAQAQTGDGNFGVRTNQFGFTITGTTNIPVVVDACTNLACPAWTPLQTCCVTNGSLYFCDPQWTNYPAHFYRVRWP